MDNRSSNTTSSLRSEAIGLQTQSNLPPPPPPPLPTTDSPHLSRPWNPKAIALLGLALTPLWCGAMAAINARRLELSGARKPLLIGAGWLVAQVVLWLTSFDFYLVQLLLLAAASWLIWCHALQGQIERFESASIRASWLDWVIPGAAGLAGALFVFCAFVLAPLLPESPHQVCDQMLRGEPEYRRDYLTQRMWSVTPFLDWLAENMDGDFKLSQGYIDRDLAKVMPEVRGGCVVYFQFRASGERYPNQCAGFLFLIRESRQWRIDEMYFNVIGDVDQGVNVPLTENAQEIRDLLERPVYAAGWTNQFEPIELSRTPIHTPPPESGPEGWRNAVKMLGFVLFHSAIGKKILLLVILLAVGKVGYDRLIARWTSNEHVAGPPD